MRPDRWQDTKSMILDKFEVLEEKTEPVEMKIGLDQSQKIGDKEVLIFISPIGKVKLEYIIKPIILDKKEHYSKRMGTSSKTEYILSENEFSYHLDAYLDKNNEWEKIDSSNLAL